MSLQRRLLVLLLVSAPFVWGLAMLASVGSARHEIDELFDAEMIRFARQVQATLAGPGGAAGEAPPPAATAPRKGHDNGEADLRDLAIAVWDARGELLLVDREGAQLPRRTDAAGFVDLALEGDRWRVYYLQAPAGQWLVAAGQRLHERDELVRNLLASQFLPWLLLLPLLLMAMTWAVRRAMAPVRALTAEIAARGPDDLQPVPPGHAPEELRPMLQAMNGLFGRIAAALDRERRFTADAAHELRTPLAVLRAQWDALRATPPGPDRERAEQRLGGGLDRLDRVVTQMLSLARLEALDTLHAPAPVDWRALVAEAFGEQLPLADRRGVELACEGDPAAFVLRGDAGLLAVLLRNLLDNAVRYAPRGDVVTLRFEPGALQVDNGGPPLPPEVQAHLGERFHRVADQAESGSGLGISIARRIAALHGLGLRHGTRPDGSGVVVRLGAA